ncbi:MAG: ATP-binding protein [Nitrospira sp.]|nr:ATP-binding protein [Nitrospira sp.]
MALVNWLPIGFNLPDGSHTKQALYEGPGWQIIDTASGKRALLAKEDLAQRWISSGLLAPGVLSPLSFGTLKLSAVTSPASQVLCPVSSSRAPNSKREALAFAVALKATRACDLTSPLQDALYIEKLQRLLPTYSISSCTDDATVLGYWLTGGARIPVTSFRRLTHTLNWLAPAQLKDIIEEAGFSVTEGSSLDSQTTSADTTEGALPSHHAAATTKSPHARFELPGRPELELFFNEHVVDIIQHPDRYKALGINFPSAVILHGPPGCGKTFAVQRLIDFLGWPSYEINASSVASPYIHETSRKVAQVFAEAIEHSPSIIVIDEMEAFLADRTNGAGHHRVEEVAEFLRRIPEAVQHRVFIVAMTNRIEMIDPAILRRGRFDHIIQVSNATQPEIAALLTTLLSSLPTEPDVKIAPLAEALSGRPLSDVSFMVREGARLAARSGKARLGHTDMLAALHATPTRQTDIPSTTRIGFV